MKRKVEKEKNTFTKKQIITMIVCTLIITLVCIFMYKENNKLISEHPEYSVQGVSEERRDTAEKLFNSVLSTFGSDIPKTNNDRIYLFQSNGFRKEILYGYLSEELKLIIALENTQRKDYNGNIPEDVKNDLFCVNSNDLYDCNEVASINGIKVISLDDLNETYKNMFGDTISNYITITNVKNSYVYSNITNSYYLKETDYVGVSNKLYYVYYNSYNSPYEHPERATVDVSVLVVEVEDNGKLYKISDVYDNLIKEHLSEKEMNEFVENIKNYNGSVIHVTYNFDNSSQYGVTLSTIEKNN